MQPVDHDISKDNTLLDTSNIQLQDLFDLEEIQRIQDAFSAAAGVASLITDSRGNPITRPSRFVQLCCMIRSTDAGLARCMQSDVELGLINPAKPIFGLCKSGRLFDGGTGITRTGSG